MHCIRVDRNMHCMRAKTPIRPVDREILTSEVLHRIVNWQHEWVLVTFFLF